MSDRHDQTPGIARRQFLQRTGALAAAAVMSRATLGADAPSSRRQIRMGVVGGGFGSTFYWHLDPGSVVTAVSDHRPERRQKLKETYRCDTVYDELEQLIQDPNVDAVAVFTGAPDHVKHSCLAMEAGKHVVCAVPACISLEEAQQLLDCKKKTGRRYMMAETSYYNSHTIAARDLFKQGAFGDLFYSEVEYNHPITQEDRDTMWFHNGRKTWRYGYAPLLYPTHATGHLVGVTRERLVSVSAHGVHTPKIEGYGKGKNRYDNPFNGSVALFQTNQDHICRCSLIWTGTRGGDRASLFGTTLSYYMPNESDGQRFLMTGPSAPKWTEPPDVSDRLPEALRIPSGHGGSHVFLTHEFVAALQGDREPAIDIYESLAMTAGGIVGQQSALRDGESLKVPSFDPAV